MDSDNRKTWVSQPWQQVKAGKTPSLGHLNHKVVSRRSEVWMHTRSVDKEFNVRGSQVSSAPSEECKPKSRLGESLSLQIHSYCKKAMIVGFISMPKMMNCDRKVCILELLQYCVFSHCSLLGHRMPFFLNRDRALRTYLTLLVCTVYRISLPIIISSVNNEKFASYFPTIIVFISFILLSLLFVSLACRVL